MINVSQKKLCLLNNLNLLKKTILINNFQKMNSKLLKCSITIFHNDKNINNETKINIKNIKYTKFLISFYEFHEVTRQNFIRLTNLNKIVQKFPNPIRSFLMENYNIINTKFHKNPIFNFCDKKFNKANNKSDFTENRRAINNEQKNKSLNEELIEIRRKKNYIDITSNVYQKINKENNSKNKPKKEFDSVFIKETSFNLKSDKDNHKTKQIKNKQGDEDLFREKSKKSEKTTISRADIKKIIKEDESIIKRRVRGAGPGGQHQNKTSSAIFMMDPATNVSIKVVNSRDSIVNEGIAKKRLLDKLDLYYNGKDSKLEQQKLKIKKQKQKSMKRSIEKHTKDIDD